jgi:ABC-2 type transport system ATP-binding protein
MKAWVGFERPSSGTVSVLGIDPWQDRPAALDHVGYVPQQPALYRGLSVADHLALVGTLRAGFDRGLAERRLDQLAIPLRQDARKLSGGQGAQVMLALALGTHAQAYILDEPLASLDPLARREFLHILVEAVRLDGATAVLASLVITDVEQVCDRMVVLGGGHKVLDQSIAEATATHMASTTEATPPASAQRTGTFMGPAGEPVTLWKVPAGCVVDPPFRAATLEEVVLGYLASSRSPATDTLSSGA